MAFLGGSAAAGTANGSSDLDILIVLPDLWTDAAFVETGVFDGQIVEAFVYGPDGLISWQRRDRGVRKPVLDRLIGDGLILRGGDGAEAMAISSRRILREGPGPANPVEIRSRRYALSALLDDSADSTDQGECVVVASALWREAAELAWTIDGRWLGTGKWLLRQLRESTDRFGLGDWADQGGADIPELQRRVMEVLTAAGGYLQSGFVRGDRPAGL